MNDSQRLDGLARRAIEGNRAALEELAGEVQRIVYRLAVRMLWNRADAEDATQEILIRVVTRLASFDFRSQFTTWVYRVAVNYLLDVKKSAVERMNLNFVEFAEDVRAGLSDDGPPEQERSVLVEEVKIGCTLAMLQCLDRQHRLAYILGDILDLSGPEAAEVLGIDAATLRKRLERARRSVIELTRDACGLVSESAICQCNRRVTAAVRLGRVDAAALQYAEHATSFAAVKATIQLVEDGRRALALQRASEPSIPPVHTIREILAKIEAANGKTT